MRPMADAVVLGFALGWFLLGFGLIRFIDRRLVKEDEE